jgi:hypothetical protein
MAPEMSLSHVLNSLFQGSVSYYFVHIIDIYLENKEPTTHYVNKMRNFLNLSNIKKMIHKVINVILNFCKLFSL